MEVKKVKTTQTVKPIFFSRSYTLITPYGIQSLPSSAPNVNENKIRTMGKEGYWFVAKEFEDYTLDMSAIIPDGFENPYALIFKDRNPNNIDAGNLVVESYGSGKICNAILLSISGQNFEHARVYTGIQDAMAGSEIPISESENNAVEITGTAFNMFQTINKPVYLEGIGSRVEVKPSDTPDATFQLGYGYDGSSFAKTLWLRETRTTTGTGGARPCRIACKEFAQSTITTLAGTFTVATTNYLCNAVIVKETDSTAYDKGQTLVTVAGTEQSSISDAIADVDDETIQLALGAGIRWCRIANIVLDNTVIGSQVIGAAGTYGVGGVTGEIHYPTYTDQLDGSTWSSGTTGAFGGWIKTINAVPEDVKQDMSTKFIDDYLMWFAINYEDETEEIPSGMTTDTSGITFTTGVKFFECIYIADKYSKSHLPAY